MGEIVNFFKDILMINNGEKIPIGLCSFENTPQETAVKTSKPKKKREIRLSELME